MVSPEWVTAGAAVVAAGATAYIAVAAVRQLWLIQSQIEQQSQQTKLQTEIFQETGNRERIWETLRACDSQSRDPIVIAAAQRIWAKSNGGTDYSNIDTPTRQDIIIILNSLESMAVGIAQGVYIDEIAYDHLKDYIEKAVMIFIKGEKYRNEVVRGATVPPDSYPYLTQLFDRWFPKGTQMPKFVTSDKIS